MDTVFLFELFKVEFRHSEEAALSALFDEFGSARSEHQCGLSIFYKISQKKVDFLVLDNAYSPRFVNYESSRSPVSHLPLLPLIISAALIAVFFR